MSTVQVLSPNGRRQNVKITPNTKILQILEEVCQKQGFLPPEEYKLVHGRKTLDVTLSVRYANLPNNAKLELVKSETSRAEEDVLIALQLENGERLQNKFSPSVSLWEVLSHWENSSHSGKLTYVDSSHSPPIQPVCIYMREEVIGELALRDVTLRKLGLTGGKAVIRLTHRPVDDIVMAEIIDKLEKEQIKKAKLEQIAKRQLSETKRELDSGGNIVSPTDQSETKEVTSKKDVNQSQSKVSAISQSEAMEVEPIPESGQTPMEIDRNQSDTKLGNDTVVDKSNSVSNETGAESKMSETSEAQKPGTSVLQSSVNSDSNIEQLRALNIPGLQIFTPQDFQELSAEEQRVARRMAAAYLGQLGLSSASQQAQQQSTKPKKLKPRQSNPMPFADFKFPEETKGQNLYRNEFSEVNKEEFKPCDRETVLFDLDEPVVSSTVNQDVPDDFFEITETDVKKMMKDLSKSVENYENQPLMTQSMKQVYLEEKYGKYNKVVIRIQFPDKMVLQGLFRPRESVFAITKFVKEYLEDKSLSFYLYTAPPKFVLKDPSKSLIEARLVPAAIVYFGSDTHKDHYLSEAVLGEVSKRSKADSVVSSHLSKHEETAVTEEMSASGSRPSASGSNVSSTSRPKPNTSDSEKKDAGKTPGVPKWLKIGKK